MYEVVHMGELGYLQPTRGFGTKTVFGDLFNTTQARVGSFGSNYSPPCEGALGEGAQPICSCQSDEQNKMRRSAV